MRHPARLFGILLGLVVLGLVVLFLTQVLSRPPIEQKAAELRYSQSQATPGFDAAQHTVTDPADLAAFNALVSKYSIDLGNYDRNGNDTCTGGLSTTVQVTLASGARDNLYLYSCRSATAGGDFVTEATNLFSSWRAGTTR